jgi:ribosomal RNA-processing protein 1
MAATMKPGAKDAARRKRKEKPVLAEAVPAAEAGNSKFARALGSTDYVTREKGLEALQRWMCLRSDLAELDMLKIWKGLFFCFWHSDKQPVQVRSACRDRRSSSRKRGSNGSGTSTSSTWAPSAPPSPKLGV